VFLNGLNDDIQFQLLNTNYADFQHMVDKAIVIENKIKEMEKDGKRKVSFSGQSSGSNVRPRFSQHNQFFWPFCVAMPHQVYHSWSRKPSEAARAAEFHACRVNHMTSDEAQQAPDVVLGMFLTSSHPTTILFDSGASHSFISSSFVAKHSLPIATMKHTMLVSSPGGEMRTKHICPAVSITIRG
jgi:hypothetical protein